MKKILYFAALAMVLLSACDDEITYAEQRANERKQIETFLKKGCTVTDPETGDILLKVAPITKRLSENDYRHILAENPEYEMPENECIYIDDLEVYMQIMRRGTGDMGKTEDGEIVRGDTLAVGQTRSVCVRYIEYNIAADSIQSSNCLSPSFAQTPDLMSVTNNGGSLTGTFTSGVMTNAYSSSNVPNAWLYPLYYIRLGRYVYADSQIAKVRIIVPSSEGQSDAYNNVYPCFYELTYEAADRK